MQTLQRTVTNLVAGISLLLAQCMFAQNAPSITLTYDEAQARMAKENLTLLANHYQIEIAQAQLLTAKLWSNPYFIWNQEMYSVAKNEFFNFTNQKLVQIEQVFSVSGKHSAGVKMAKMNIEMNRLLFSDVMRSLSYELDIQFSNLQSLQEKKALYESMIQYTQSTVDMVATQVRLGALPAKENTRLATEFLDLQTEYQGILSEMENCMSSMRILLAIPDNVSITVVPRNFPVVTGITEEDAITLAKELRPDYKYGQMSIDYQKANLRLQKANAMPDLKLGYQPHDRGSNYVRPYSGMTFEMPLPIFDRNQGGIQEAKFGIKAAEAEFKKSENQLRQEIFTSFNQFKIHLQGYERFSPSFLKDMEEMQKNFAESYAQRAISLLEYLDQQRMFVQSKLSRIDQLNHYMQSVNDLNFRVGRKIVE
jgi:outer membrane protein, heavy metal efflux system